MLNGVMIRPEAPPDARAVRIVVEAAFGRREEADLVDRLRADGDCVISLVAVDGGEVIGHVLFSKMAASFPALGLGPIAVKPDRQGAGVGTSLIRAGLEQAREGGWLGVFVLGAPEYYRRFGFDPARASAFSCRYSGPHLMALALHGPELPASPETIDYAPAFRMLD